MNEQEKVKSNDGEHFEIISSQKAESTNISGVELSDLMLAVAVRELAKEEISPEMLTAVTELIKEWDKITTLY